MKMQMKAQAVLLACHHPLLGYSQDQSSIDLATWLYGAAMHSHPYLKDMKVAGSKYPRWRLTHRIQNVQLEIHLSDIVLLKNWAT